MSDELRVILSLQAIAGTLREIVTELGNLAEKVNDVRDEIEDTSKAHSQQMEQVIGNLAGLREEIRFPTNG